MMAALPSHLIRRASMMALDFKVMMRDARAPTIAYQPKLALYAGAADEDEAAPCAAADGAMPLLPYDIFRRRCRAPCYICLRRLLSRARAAVFCSMPA